MFMNNLISRISLLLTRPGKHDFLRKFNIFDDFNNHELYLFSQILQKRQFKEGEIIYQEEFPLAVIYLIADGAIDLKAVLNNQVRTDVLSKHQFLGIIDMYNENRRKEEARAKQETLLYAISHLDFQAFIKANPKTGVKLLNNICNNLSRYIVELQKTTEE